MLIAVFWIRIHMDPHSIGRQDPDPGGLKRATGTIKKNNAAKRQIIRHNKYKNQCNWYKNVYCDLISIKNLTLIFDFDKKFCF
jgi:hypothetical protein